MGGSPSSTTDPSTGADKTTVDLTLQAASWFSSDGTRDYDAKNCYNDADKVSRHRKGKAGRRRHHCVKATNYTVLKYNEAREGSNPCSGFNSIKY